MKDFEKFGKAIWNHLCEMNDFFENEESEWIMQLAEECDITKKVCYSPDKHGDLDLEPGDLIWSLEREE